MQTRTRWLLVITLGLMVHLHSTNTVVAKLSPYNNMPAYTTGLPPYGQVNFHTADTIAFLLQIILFLSWVAFTWSLMVEKPPADRLGR